MKNILYSETVFRICLIFHLFEKSSFHYVVNTIKYFGEISHEMVLTVNPIYLSVQYFIIIFLSIKWSFDFIYMLFYI